MDTPSDAPRRPPVTPLTPLGYWVAYLSPLGGLVFLALLDRLVLARVWPLAQADSATFVLALVLTFLYSHGFLTRIRAQYEETDRLLDTTSLQRDRLRLLQETLTTMAANRDWQAILQRVVELSRELTGARLGVLSVWNPDGVPGRLITSGLSAHEAALLDREDASPDLATAENPLARLGDGAVPPIPTMGVPVRFRDQVLGHLYLADKPTGPFTANDEELVGLLAGQAGVLITNARLNEELERLAVVEERQRIGMDLHDGTIQSLYGVMLTIDTLLAETPPTLSALRTALDVLGDRVARISDDIRHYVFDLKQDRQDWPEALAAMIAELGLSGIADVRLADHSYRQLSSRQLTYLLSFVREALTNVARHAQASRASVSWRASAHQFRVEIRDNGVGFETDAGTPANHYGLTHLQERATNLGASLTIASRPHQGTRIVLVAPLHRRLRRRLARADAARR